MPTLQLLSVAETAQRLNLSARTIWRLIERGDLRPTRIGTRVSIQYDELQRFIATRSAGSADVR